MNHSPSVNLKRKIKIEGKWKFVPIARNGERFIQDHVVIAGKPTKVTTGSYYVEWWEGKKRRQKSVGSNWRQASDALRVQSHVLALRKEGTEVEDAPQIQSGGNTLRNAVNDYLRDAVLSDKSRAKYRNALHEFADFVSISYVESLKRDNILSYMRYLENERNLDPGTASDKGAIVLTFARKYGATIKMEKGDWPKSVERKPRLYQRDAMKLLFEAANQDEFELFQTFRLSGFREQELGFASWNDDFDPVARTLSVTAKREMGFKPKNYQERTVEITQALVDLLAARRKRYPDSYLLFPTSQHNKARGMKGGRRDRHMLDRLKKLAKRAGLNCGHCKGKYNKKSTTCAKAPICKKWGLHMFRHTYATTLLRDGVDLLTLQRLLGHKDLDSTKKYLYAALSDETQKMISVTRLASLEIL